MKKNFTLYLLCVFALLISSCNKEEKPSSSVQGEETDCLVSLNMVGEISTSESELTKASTTTNNLYAVQVKKGSDNFAFGIFDDLSLMKLNLKQGSSYSIYVCMVADAKSYIDYFSLTNNGVIGRDSGPFCVYDGGYCGARSDVFNYFIMTNRFFYVSNGYYNYFENSTATSYKQRSTGYGFYLNNIERGWLNDTSYPTCTDWFYGRYENYTPTGEFGSISIPLKRTGFKLKYELSGVTDGSVTVKIYNGSRTFIENTTTTASYASDTQFIAFYDTYSAWKYADNYTENMKVAVTWVRGIGITQNLGTKTVQVKRNCLNNIKIKLGSDDRGAGVSLTAEAESSMGSAENNIPVE